MASDEDTIAQRLDRMLDDARADAAREVEADRAWAATATWDDVDALARKLVAANEAAEAGVGGAWKESVRLGQRLATVHEVRRMDPRQLKAAGLVIRDKWPGDLFRGWTIRVLIKVTEDLREMERTGRESRRARLCEPRTTRVELDSLGYATDFEWAVAQVRNDLRAVDAVGVRLKRPWEHVRAEIEGGARDSKALRFPRLKMPSNGSESGLLSLNEAIRDALAAFKRPRRRGRLKAGEVAPPAAMVELWRTMGLLPEAPQDPEEQDRVDAQAKNAAELAISREQKSAGKWSELEWARTPQGWAPRK